MRGREGKKAREGATESKGAWERGREGEWHRWKEI